MIREELDSSQKNLLYDDILKTIQQPVPSNVESVIVKYLNGILTKLYNEKWADKADKPEFNKWVQDVIEVSLTPDIKNLSKIKIK